MKIDTKKTIEVLKRIYNNPNSYGCCGETADAFKYAIEALGERDMNRHELTNRDISEKYRAIEMWLLPSDFLGAFAYWVTAQNPNKAVLEVKPSLVAFKDHILSAFKNNLLPEKFTYDRLQEYINDKAFERIPAILALNEMKPDYIGLGALARNVFYMILREHITQS